MSEWERAAVKAAVFASRGHETVAPFYPEYSIWKVDRKLDIVASP
jgi:hypothetical protein